MHKISIIIPVFNTEKYIEECLNSVFSQSFTDYEVIVINDGSTDGTADIFECYRKEHSNLTVKTIENHGQGYARNLGLSMADGEYIQFIDADDYVSPVTLEYALYRAEEDASDCVCYNWTSFISETGAAINVKKQSYYGMNLLENEECRKLYQMTPCYTVATLYRKDFLLKNDVSYGEGHLYEDILFWLKAVNKAKKVSIIDEAFYRVRVNQSSSTQTGHASSRHIDSFIWLTEESNKYIREYSGNNFNDYYDYLVDRFFKYHQQRVSEDRRDEFSAKFIQAMQTASIDASSPQSERLASALEVIHSGDAARLSALAFEKRGKKKSHTSKSKSSFKKRLKKSLKSRLMAADKKGTAIGLLYRRIITRKRQNTYDQYAELPVDAKLVVFESFMGRKFTDSPRAIYEYMLSNSDYDEYHFVWAFREGVLSDYRFVAENDRTSIVKWGTDEYYRTYATAAFWIVNTRVPYSIKVRDGQKYVQCWHGTPLKRLGCDIISEETQSQEETVSAVHRDASRYSYLISPSRFVTEKLSSAFDLEKLKKENIILELGYPRNDALSCFNEEKIRKIKSSLGISMSKKVILYAPTYRENQRERGVGYTYDEPLDFGRLRENIGSDYVILYRAHYYVASSFDFSKYQGWVIDASSYPEINDLYIISDLLITDYSSVFFDYSNLGRPILFYMYDYEFYKNQLRGFYLRTEELPGPITKNQEELEKAINSVAEWSSAPDYRDKYEAFVHRFASMDDGNASERVVKAIL